MAANRRKQGDKNLETLRELISINGNKYCLDCNQRGPTYVNTTIGSFVCSKCSGQLRGLTPPHRVKSISMATFTPTEIEFVKSKGNDYCRRVWLGLYEGESVNFTDEQSVRDFMSDKYEKKRYYLDSATKSSGLNNGFLTNQNKVKTKSSTNSAPLLSITPQISRTTSSRNNTVNTSIPSHSFLVSNDNNQKTFNNFSQLASNTNSKSVATIPPPVPDFPVDFSTANIYNSNEANDAGNNNISQTTNFTINSTPASNDRYAALADLDQAFRNQSVQRMEENTIVNSKNPFQNHDNNNVFLNKNPFFNGGWNAVPSVPVNPFMPPTSNGNFANSKNPFM